MKLLTLNTHSWREENMMEKIGHLAEQIIKNDYDIIALQEVNQFTDSPFIKNSYLRENNFMVVLQEEIKKRKGARYYSYYQTAKCLHGHYEEGSCVLSKTPFTDQDVFIISTGQDYTYHKRRNVVKITTCYKGQMVDVFSCHMGWWHDEEDPFKPQCDRLLKKINREHLGILMGDFNNNANIRGEGYDYLLGHQIWDTYNLAENKDRGTTVKGEISGWKDNKDDLRIDLILLNKPVATKWSRVIFNGENGQIVSDHYGVEAEIVL